MRGFTRLSLLLVVGAIVGVWTFVQPWVIGFPFGAQNQWSPSVWSSVWIGAIVIAASLTGLVLAVAVGLRSALPPPASAEGEREQVPPRRS